MKKKKYAAEDNAKKPLRISEMLATSGGGERKKASYRGLWRKLVKMAASYEK